ncbi:MAG TPA: tRNA pseudouridine(55) synthase TruB [Rubrivivax sp.]|nr:tRNA pseudouridine(55) synthase TruB [Rubrivivax sp.]
MPPRQRIPRRAVHGVLLLDKPLGLSSNDALQQAKRLFRAEKAGHTGTLDPLATGLLPLCFGAATKFAQASLDADKRYLATLRLGQTTSTGDAEGDVLERREVTLDRVAIDAAIARFVGTLDQLPPMHSALKHEGRALYEYARRGVAVERAPRRVTIHRLDVVAWQGDTMVLDVLCSKGTYVRTLAADIGAQLGCGAHLSALRRTASGTLTVEGALMLDALAGMDEAQRDAQLKPADALLAGWPRVQLPDDEAGRFLTGLRRRVSLADAAAVRVYGPRDAFLGSAHIAGGELIADRLLTPAEVAGCIESKP